MGIPFCPTRCAYCSFVSRSVGKKTELLEPYLEALEREGLTPKDIDTVLYTHLHNDHAGCALLFPEAKTYFQKDEQLSKAA